MAADRKNESAAAAMTKAEDPTAGLLYVPEDDRAKYTKVDTSYAYYNPMFSQKDDAGKIVSPESFVILHGIPWKRAARMQATPDGESVRGFYYAVYLTAPCTVKGRVEGKKGLQWHIAPPGTWVLVDEKAGLKALADFLPEYPDRKDGKPDVNAKPIAVHDVRIEPTAREDFERNGVNMKAWRFDIRERTLDTVPGGRRLLPPAMPKIEHDEDGQDLPF